MADSVLAAANPQIDIDHEVEDEAIGSDIASDTTSLKSYAMKYDFEYGRRYQSDIQSKYFFPNDEEEQDRMDLEHTLWKHMLEDKLFLAPTKDPRKILDIGTGTGFWAIEVADNLPGAQVIGTDLDNTFDLIHGRLLCGSVTDYNKLAKQAFAALKPGGFFELQDLHPRTYYDDGSLPEDSAVGKWGELAVECVHKAGRSVLDVHEYREVLEKAGFVNIKEAFLRRPFNTWAKDPKMKRIGLFQLCNMLAGVYAWSVYLFVNVLGWKQQEVEVFCAQIRTEIRNTRYHSYGRCVAVYGQKPEA